MTDQIFLGDTINKQFSTVAPSTGVPTTLAGTPVISAYPDGSTTQITAGITLTVDHDSVTGGHNVAVVATAANGYDYGVRYTLKITTGTVDSVSAVGHVIGEFYIYAAADRRLGIVDYGVAQSFTSTTAVLRAALSIPDDEIIGSILAIGNQSRVITGWDNSTDTATVDTWTTTPTGTPNYVIHRSPPLEGASVRTAIGMASADLDTQLAALPTAAENRAEMDSNSAQLAAIVADTNELQSDDIPGLIAALNDPAVSDILTTQMTESYAANGTAPTLAQALFAIHQSLMHFGISGTSKTVLQLDDSTTAFVETLDDASDPTAVSRT